MPVNDTDFKKIYNATASVIMDLCFKKQINEAEMYFLLNLLELIWNEEKGEKGNDFLENLTQWQAGAKSAEIDEIIKETLMSIDFSDEQSLRNITIMVQELLAAQKD